MEKTDQRQEAYVDEQEWSRYMGSAQLTVIEAKQRPHGGRKPLAAMSDILVELAASMLAQQRLHPGLDREYKELASTAVAKVEQKLGRGIKVPQSEYIAKKASEIYTLRDKMLEEAGLLPDRVGAADEPKSGR
jgi:hypothetical protein